MYHITLQYGPIPSCMHVISTKKWPGLYEIPKLTVSKYQERVLCNFLVLFEGQLCTVECSPFWVGIFIIFKKETTMITV